MTVSPMLKRDDDSIHVSATELSITATQWEDWPGAGKNSVFFSVRLQAAQASIAGVLTKAEAVAIARALIETAISAEQFSAALEQGRGNCSGVDRSGGVTK